MNIWIRRTLGFFLVGGSALGLSPSLTMLINGSNNSPITIFVAIIIYGCGAVVGLQTIEGSPKYIRNNLIFWAAQIPFIQSSIFSYYFFNGTQLQITMRLIDLRMGITWNMLGSVFQLVIGNTNSPGFIGVNIFALMIVMFLVFLKKSYEKSIS